MEMQEKEFNLLYEPWIVVMMQNNATQEMSILELFKNAHEVKKLAGELPTQDIAIMRLLLAIMHAAFVRSNVSNEEEALQLWQELWGFKQFPYGIIESYLKQYENRFWLFHPEFPFYQVAKLENGTEYLTKKLVGTLSESNNKTRLFSERVAIGKEQVTYAEAARWLLYVNAFDDTSSKPTKKDLGSPGAGWLGKLGLIYAQGDNFFETLLLNFVLFDSSDEIFEDGSINAQAYWERDTVADKERVNIAQPRAQKELLTLQSRRLKLQRSGGVVTGFKLLGGDFFEKENALNEQMTMWRQDAKTNVYQPKRHQSSKQLWRDFAAILASGQETRESGIVKWLEVLKEHQIYTKPLVNFCVTGIEYGDKDFFVEEIINDSIQLNASLLKKANQAWRNAIIDLLQQTEKAVAYLGYLAVDISVAGGNRRDSKDKNRLFISANAKSLGYIKLGSAFREWLLNINIGANNIENDELEWLAIARKIIHSEGERMIAECSEKALAGWIKKGKETDESSNVFVSFRKFEMGLRKTLG